MRITDLGPRRWLAWKLVRVAFRLCDTEYQQRIIVTNKSGVVVASIGVVGDAYGCGISDVFSCESSCADGVEVQISDE